MGSVHAYTISAGKRYRVLYRKPDHSQGQKRGFTTKKAAELYLSTVEIAKARGEFVDPSASSITVADLGPAWLERKKHLKPSAYRALESAWDTHVLPTWGGFQLGKISQTAIQAWTTTLSATRSATTVSRAYGVLAAILDDAVSDRRLNRNPARGVNLPRKTGKRRMYLSHAQVRLLAREAGSRSTLVLFFAYTGLRWGEATGLRVRDVDPVKRRVSVHENAVNVNGTVHVGTPKTHAARSVPFPAFLAAPLAAAADGKKREQLLFGDGDVHVRPPDGRRGWFVSAVARCMEIDETFPKVTIHDLRHTAASLAISAGANVKAVQRMLGHASAAMTLDTYADLFDDDLDAVATALDLAKFESDVAIPLPERGSGNE